MKRWVERNAIFNNRIINIIENEGEDPKNIKIIAIGSAIITVRKEMEKSDDKYFFCESFADYFDLGLYDLDKMESVQELFVRVMRE